MYNISVMSKILAVNSISHFLVDAVCLAVLSGAAGSGAEMFSFIILYNTLAFSTQCVAGLFTDRYRLSRKLEAPSMLLTALGLLLPLPVAARVVIIGIGNSFFHVCGGTVTLERSEGKAAPLGVFVAPGALGVAVGRIWPQLGVWLAAALAVFALLVHTAYRNEGDIVLKRPPYIAIRPFPMPAIVLLTVATAVRAVGGSAVSFSWKTGVLQAVLLSISVFAGKAAGGFLCDRLGAVKTALVSVPPAAVITAFAAGSIGFSLIGQLLLNLSMPVTLWLLYKLMPDDPGFAFGLAASALWPGMIAGKLFRLTGPALWLCVLLSFAVGLVAVIYSVNVLERGKRK